MKPIKFLLFALLLSGSVTSQYLMNPNVRSASVLIKSSKGFGSGFLITDSVTNNIFIVTALHVLVNEDMSIRTDSLDIIAYRENPDIDPQIQYKLSIKGCVDSKALRLDKKNDLAILKFAKVEKRDSTFFLQYPQYVKKKSKESLIQPWSTEGVAKIDDVLSGSEIFIVGFPRSLGLKSNFDLDRPLYRKGIIAGKNIKLKRIIGDGAVYFGNSGGMVVCNHFDGKVFSIRLIGLVSEYIPYEDYLYDNRGIVRSLDVKNSGYSVIIPVDFILDLINGFY
jgi:S1-C subfamily serine protease